jgi:hypothetical protein
MQRRLGLDDVKATFNHFLHELFELQRKSLLSDPVDGVKDKQPIEPGFELEDPSLKVEDQLKSWVFLPFFELDDRR